MTNPDTASDVPCARIRSWQLGETRIHVVCDGELSGDKVVLDGLDCAAADAALAATGGVRTISVNCFVIESGGRRALVDFGGALLYPELGALWDGLAALGLSAEDFDTLLLTHMHPDHVGALIDKDGKAAFANAELVLARADFDFWANDANRPRVVERVRPWFDLNGRVIDAYDGRTRLFDGGEVFPGVEAVPLPGHTPGHTGYAVSGGDGLLIWGDIMHRPDIQAPHPEARIPFDVDPDEAVRTRSAILDHLASSGAAVAGMHLHFPALSRVERAGGAYRIVPDDGLAC